MDEWELLGFDTFEGEYYRLQGFETEAEALNAAKQKAEDLDKTQPKEQSGGQDFYGIQDRLYIKRPDGSTYQYTW